MTKNFSNIGYEDFKKLASDPSLSKYEKIGFPDAYRAGHEEQIFSDICSKVTNLTRAGQTVLDIGPGCSDLPVKLISSVAWGGAGLDQLYVTTIDPVQFGWAPEEGGGNVYVVEGLGTRGVPEGRYAG